MHSRYERSLSDVAVGGHRVRVRVRLRRFFCDDVGCAGRTLLNEKRRYVNRPLRVMAPARAWF
ncbi:hypothetical protein KUA19_07500 [Catellatospora sp. NEAU-YM18]|nr:hypothetical protein [Catellatospora tritici]